MTDTILNLDQELFLGLNSLHTPWLDPIMMCLTGKLIWVPLYVAIAALIIWKFGWKRGLIMVAAIGLAVACADLICAKGIRPLCHRLRPANLENPISSITHIVDGYRGGRYGFPSCHAANTFALATASAGMLRLRWFAIFIFLWAAMQCYTRVYLGVHYPGDLIMGALIGATLGFLASFACRRTILSTVGKRETITHE